MGFGKKRSLTERIEMIDDELVRSILIATAGKRKKVDEFYTDRAVEILTDKWLEMERRMR
jgi:hypothetical protein